MRSGDDSSRGLYKKFKVERTDGKDGPGQRHEHCRYFVLDLDHDEFAYQALATYRDQCATKFPALASDIGRFLRGENVFNDWRPGE